MTLAAIDTRKKDNNLTLIRTLAALSVTFGHSFILFSGTTVNVWPGINSGYFGFMAVAVFFGFSGYLVTQSFCNSKSWAHYLEARCLRIFPGLVFANLVTVLIVALVVKRGDVAGEFLASAGEYVASSFVFGASCMPGVFATNPTDCVNGSLWTLGIEFRYYFIVMLLGLLGFYRKIWRFLAALAFAVVLAMALPSEVASSLFSKTIRVHSLDSTFLSLAVSFVLGMLFYLFRTRVYLSVIAALVGVLVAYYSEYWFVKVVLTVYACFVFGFHPKLFIQRFPKAFDLSYGIYVLSYPIQQTFISLKVLSSSMEVFLATCAVVIPLAWVSWTVVESPALRLKGRFAKYYPA